MSYSTALNSINVLVTIDLMPLESGNTTPWEIQISNDSYFAILKSIRGLDQDHDQFMPLSTSGQIVLDNSEGSIGFQRRFSDFLETHSIVEQRCLVEFRLQTRENEGRTFTEYFAFKMQDVSIDDEREEITINLKNNPISEKVISKEINTTDFSNAPVSSIGRYLPLVFGEGARVLCEKTGNKRYAYATNFGTGYQCGDISKYFVQSLAGEYQEIEFAGSTATAVLDSDVSSASAGVNIGFGKGWELQDFTNNQTGYIVDRGRIYLKGSSVFPTSGELTIQLVEGYFSSSYRRVIPTFKILGTAIIDKNSYAANFNGTSGFWANFTFNDSVIIGKSEIETLKYYLLISDNDSATFPVQYYDYNLTSGTIETANYSDNSWVQASSSSSTTGRFELYSCTVTDTSSTTTDNKGLAYHEFAIESGTSDHNLSKFNFGVEMDGLGASGVTDTTAPSIIKQLITLSGNDYIDADYDNTWTELTSGTYPRTISGALTGRNSVNTAIRELARNSACRVFNVSGHDSTYSNYEQGIDILAWGGNLDDSGIPQMGINLYDHDIKTESIGIAGRDLTITEVTANYKKDPIQQSGEEFIRQGIASGYTAILRNRSYNSEAITRYGSNDLLNNRFDLIADETSMQSVANYFLRSFENPPIYFEISLPYTPLQFLAGKTIEVLTPKLPAFYGTSSQPLAPIDQNDQEVTIIESNHNVRAQRYRALIEGRRVEMDESGLVLIYLRCRALKNTGDPT